MLAVLGNILLFQGCCVLPSQLHLLLLFINLPLVLLLLHCRSSIPSLSLLIFILLKRLMNNLQLFRSPFLPHLPDACFLYPLFVWKLRFFLSWLFPLFFGLTQVAGWVVTAYKCWAAQGATAVMQYHPLAHTVALKHTVCTQLVCEMVLKIWSRKQMKNFLLHF